MLRSTKARLGHVGDQVGQVKDQVGQGQGQELDNINISLDIALIIFYTFYNSLCIPKAPDQSNMKMVTY